MILLTIITIIIISLSIIFFTRNSKYRGFIWGFCSIITLIPIIFAVWFVWAQFQTPDFKTLNCGSNKFYYVGDPVLRSENYYIAKNKDKYNLSEYRIANLVKKNDTYVARFYDSPEDTRARDFTQLLSCKEFDLNAMYQPYQPVNPDNLSEIKDKDRCYLLNRTGETDYPECSPEVKAKFELK